MNNQRKWKHRRYELSWKMDGRIYHYTDLNGLFGIASSNGVWASGVSYMNDAHEISHGIELSKCVLSRYAKDCRSRHFRSVLNRSVEILDHTDRPDFYIACFSLDGDNLDLWRGYTRHGTSVAIEIDLGQGNPFSLAPVMQLKGVTYGTSAQARRVLLHVKRFESEFSEDEEFYRNDLTFPNGGINFSEETAKHLVSSIVHILPTFKNPSFRSEREVRLVLHGSHGDRFGGKRFRPSKHFLVPYLATSELKATDQERKSWKELHPLPITRVIVGPSPYAKLAANSIREYFKVAKKTVDVELSRIPYQEFR